VRQALPIDAHLDHIVREVRRARAAVIVAAPGAGKTTRVPPALAVDGPVLVLQPRRIAARTLARRVAEEQGWAIGNEVGWHVRFERRFGARTQVLFATEGILTARLQQDPLASDFRTIILDEFHERSLHADLGLAFARQAQLARDDLRVVVMSATIDAAPIARFLGDCPVIEVAGRLHALEVEYDAGQPLADAAIQLAEASRGQVLCFLPGAGEIRRAQEEIARRAPGLPCVPLHGSLSPEEQDRALSPPDDAVRIVLATNIAETSLTVPGVDTVIDTGLHKVARYDPGRGIDSLETERISRDSADQRAGRAARLGPGRVRRLWDARDRLRPGREPDLARVDLASPVLDICAWGAEVKTFPWFDAPPTAAVSAALELLERLGALDDGRITARGRQLQSLPLHPRLAALLLAARGAHEAAAVCAVLAERHLLPPRHESTTCDLLAIVDRWRDAPGHVRQVARVLEDSAQRQLGANARPHVDERALRGAIFAAYPDRLAQRRRPNGDTVLLASGAGATLARECGVREGEWLVAIEVRALGGPGGDTEPRVHLASLVDQEWITPTDIERIHVFDETSGRVRALRRLRYGALTLSEQHDQPDPHEQARLLSEAWRARGPSEADRRLLARLRFAQLAADEAALIDVASRRARSLDSIDLGASLDDAARAALDRLAPDSLRVPSGRSVRLEYQDGGGVTAAVKLQELFGLADTPRVGARQEPVLLHLLAPNGRAVQMTRDLKSFWTRTYPEVRRELRGRYPKHPWPDDPWTAVPTARTTRRK
jgi:ATP-dependent helicase HrpB